MLELLKKLCEIDGVSSFEENVREFIRKEAEPYADEIFEDVLGNLYVHGSGAAAKRKLMFAAHMDEVGFIIKSITEDGYLKFAAVGGIDARVIIGKRVRVGVNRLPGVIGIKAVHLTKPEERKKTPEINELYIDVGAKDREAAGKLTAPGDYAAFDSGCVEFGDGMLKAKAIDDRIGCAVMLKLLKDGPRVDCWYVFTVQEEVGLRGAGPAAHRLAPETAIILEGTTAGDLPGTDEHRRVCAPGRGAVIPFMDGGTLYSPELYRELTGLAVEKGIAWQTKNVISGGTDAGAVQRSRGGVRSAAISAAVRYIHSPSSVACIRDFESIYSLAAAYLYQSRL
ncbi:MAG: M42 family metallopeptidase [Oscillospiraceae bacterium]|jgi:endoglucanase|nr:M42 family metallopeptidase [Oscillospiraceae bacterium]